MGFGSTTWGLVRLNAPMSRQSCPAETTCVSGTLASLAACLLVPLQRFFTLIDRLRLGCVCVRPRARGGMSPLTPLRPQHPDGGHWMAGWDGSLQGMASQLNALSAEVAAMRAERTLQVEQLTRCQVRHPRCFCRWYALCDARRSSLVGKAHLHQLTVAVVMGPMAQSTGFCAPGCACANPCWWSGSGMLRSTRRRGHHTDVACSVYNALRATRHQVERHS